MSKTIKCPKCERDLPTNTPVETVTIQATINGKPEGGAKTNHVTCPFCGHKFTLSPPAHGAGGQAGRQVGPSRRTRTFAGCLRHGGRKLVSISGRVFCRARRFFAPRQSPSLFEHPPQIKGSSWMGWDKPGGAGGGKGRGAKRARVSACGSARGVIIISY